MYNLGSLFCFNLRENKLTQIDDHQAAIQVNNLEESKPGGFQTGGFSAFFGKGPDCVADPFRTVPRRCSLQIMGREQGKELIGKIPEKIGKSCLL